MINACCNLYFWFIIIVHGDIRHLEIFSAGAIPKNIVHGDIRHLEKHDQETLPQQHVHGDIRHLEKEKQ